MEMLERVARAIALQSQSCRESDWPFFADMARAAIEAMREPTEAMIDMGVLTDGLRSDRQTNPEFFADRHWMECSYRAMIQAALSTTQPDGA